MTELRVKDMLQHKTPEAEGSREEKADENAQLDNPPQDPLTKTQTKPAAANPKMRFQSIHDKRPWEANSFLKFYGDSSYTHKVNYCYRRLCIYFNYTYSSPIYRIRKHGT
jgi:hypothetical protein